MSSRLGRVTSSPSSSMSRSSAQPVSSCSSLTGAVVLSVTSSPSPIWPFPGMPSTATPMQPKLIVVGWLSRSPRSSGVPAATISPAGDDRHPVGEPLRLVHVVGGEEDGLAEVAQAGDHVPGLAPRRGVEAGRRLVEEEQLGVADQRHADVEAALLAAGETAGAGVRLAAEADQLDRLLDRPRRAVVAGVEPERLAHGQVGIESAALQDDPDPLAPGAPGVLRDPRPAPRPRRRCACGSPRGSPPSSSCRRRWARGRRRPRPRSTSRSMPAHRLEVAIALAQAADGDDGIGQGRRF